MKFSEVWNWHFAYPNWHYEMKKAPLVIFHQKWNFMSTSNMVKSHAKGGEMPTYKVKYCGGPKKSNIFIHKMLPPHPPIFLMLYLRSSGNFLLENFVGIELIFLKLWALYPDRCTIFRFGGVTQKGVSSKHIQCTL